MRHKLLQILVVVFWTLSQSAWAGDNPLFPLNKGAYSKFATPSGVYDEYSLVVGEENYYGQDVWVVKYEYETGIGGPHYDFFSIADDGDVLHHGSRFTQSGSMIENVLEPPVRLIDAPIISGKSWTDEFTLTRYVDGSIDVVQENHQQYGRIESVDVLISVPAGDYATVEVFNSPIRKSPPQIRYWFSEGVGIVKKTYPGNVERLLMAPVVQSDSKSWGSVKALFR